MNKLIYWGNYDSAFVVFRNYILPKYNECSYYVDDFIDFNRINSDKGEVYLQTTLSDKIGADCISFSTSGFEGKSVILKKLIVSLNTVNFQGTVNIITTKKTGETFLKRVLTELNLKITINTVDSYDILTVIRTIKGKINIDEIFEKYSLKQEILFSENIAGIDFLFHSSQQLFSKEKADTGSLFLINTAKIKSNEKVLDFGCGYGIIGIALSKIYNLSNVSFVDIKVSAYEKTIQNIKENLPNRNFKVYLTNDLKSINDKFDVILSHFPIHIPGEEKIKIIQSCYATLEKNGRLICVIPKTFDFKQLIKSVFGNYTVIEQNDEIGYYIFETTKRIG